MESKLNLLAILLFLLSLNSCAGTKNAEDIERIYDDSIRNRMVVELNTEQLSGLVNAAFQKGKSNREEISFNRSKLKLAFEEVSSSFDLDKIMLLNFNQKHSSVYPQVAQKKSDSLIVYVASYGETRITPSYRFKGEPTKMLGDFFITLEQRDDGKTLLNIFGKDLQVYGNKSCSLHTMECGRTAPHVQSAPFEEYRILLYLSDVLRKHGLAFEMLPIDDLKK